MPPGDAGGLCSNRRRLEVGLSSLFGGVAYYLIVRPAGSVWFLPRGLGLHTPIPRAVLQLTGFVPTLSHTLSFSLLSAGVLATGRRGSAIICAAWMALESIFELGQRPEISAWLIAHMPLWIDRVWLLSNAPRYFARGTFDAADLAAIAAGASIAFVVTCFTPSPRVAA